jgi:DNA repair protein SbcD/Mre11
MRFQFIHAADLHIDSPLDALGTKDAAIKATFAAASRKAVERLIAETIDSGAKFLIIAGDVFDGDWRDVSTGLFFVRELGKLHRAGLPTFIVRGNHDAESVISRSLPYPASAHVFDARKGHTHLVEDLRVAVHGRSFSERGAPDDFLSGYAPRREGWLNIGVLHTSLDGARGHNPYAPCTTADLSRFGYDYWALGHIHAPEIVARDPWVVYPGNVQGRSPRETGPKGAVRVTVEDGRVVAAEPFALDAARWAHERVDVTGLAAEEAVLGRIADALALAQVAAEGRPLAVRLTLTGETPAHAVLVARRETLQDEARSRGFALAADCWVEQLRLETRAPTIPASFEPDALDIAGLIAATADDPEFASLVAELAASVADKLPRELRGAFLESDPATHAALARDRLLGERG